MELEAHDRRILHILQEDTRISNQELAEKAAMSASACWRRVKALEEAGIIDRYSAIVDASKAGLGFHAVVFVHLVRHEAEYVDGFITEIQRRPEVLDCFATTGEADYHLRVRCRDLDAYNAFLDGVLFLLPGVANVRTSLVLKEIKHQTMLNME
jgi:Lrp/AsnC family transcriptional regulator, leucine-responsive regulatory protein